MATSRIKVLHEILKPHFVKWGSRIVVAFGLYDLLSNQSPSWHLPKLGDQLPRWLGMSGALLPWWGWLLILQAIFVYALFEYVRRNVPVKSEGASLTHDQVREINLDLLRLLHFTVDVATFIATKRLIDVAPMETISLEPSLDRREEARGNLRRFIREAGAISGGDHGYGPDFQNAIHGAEREADDELARRVTEDHKLTTVMPQLRDAIVLEKQRDAALKFLQWRLRMKEDDVARGRSGLIECKERRDPP
jgi:hypothetical protein